MAEPTDLMQIELLRVRDRLHDFINTISARVGMTDVELARLTVRVAELEDARDHYVPVIDSLVQSNAIAVALTEQLRGTQTVRFARWQILLATVALATPYLLFALAWLKPM